MAEISSDYPDMKLYLVIEKMTEPDAYFWQLTISLTGEEPPTPIAPRRIFCLRATTEALEKALDEYPCDNVNIFAESNCPEQVITSIRTVFEIRAMQRQS